MEPIYQATYSQAVKHVQQGKLVVLADLHLGAPHEMFTYTQVLALLELGAISVGDLIDIANVPKKKVKKWLERLTYIAIQYPYRTIFGNHECRLLGPEFLKLLVDQTTIGFTHGHLLTYSKKKIAKWLSKKGGRNFWRFQIYKLKHLRHKKLKELSTPQSYLQKVADYCDKIGVAELYIGHTHRYKEISFQIDGKTYALHACPRGITLFDRTI